MTFSVVARCTMSGQFGVAISSSSPAVAARCAHARAGIGAVTTQNITNPALGPLMLDQLAAGRNSVDAVSMAIKDDKFSEYRQLLAIDRHGTTAVHSGAHSLGLWNTSHGIDCVTGVIFLQHPKYHKQWSWHLNQRQAHWATVYYRACVPLWT